MIRYGLLALAGSAISLVALLGFVVLAGMNSPLKYSFVLGYVLGTAGLFFFAGRLMNVYSVVRLSCVVAIATVCIEQLLGFCCFPGLVKDLVPFEGPHLQTLAQALLTAIGRYLFVALAATGAANVSVRRGT